MSDYSSDQRNNPGDHDTPVLAILRSAFAEEILAAESDLRLAAENDRITARMPKISRGMGWRARSWHGRKALFQAGALGVIVLVASVVALAPLLMPAASPATQASATVPSISAASVATPSGASVLLYDDGIPRTLNGAPVLRAAAALAAASQSTDASPFLIAFWAGIEPPHSCIQSAPDSNPLFDCGAMLNVGDRAGVASDALGRQLRVDTSAASPGPVIVRVHTHDTGLAHCPALDQVACEHIMVGDAILWTGDQATGAHPTSLDQAASAFGVTVKDSAASCSAGRLPGIAILSFPSSGAGDGAEGIIAVFPSPQALANAAPDVAATGESEIPPLTSPQCDHFGTDSRRGPGEFSFRFHWLARGNILVGVQYDVSVGASNDTFVSAARTRLASLLMP